MAEAALKQAPSSAPRTSRPAQGGPQLTLVRKVEVDRARDALLTDFGKTTLEDRYLLPGESYQDMFARVATAYADDADHAQRIYDYISRLW
ncbi:MAG: ribonucleotide-diphosphate reductase subunit alpha, partial [Caulobacteraceae bacterium]|nr:ribonucleotide-diphosphate reductase subunit alpha [Caulobacter sp.]